MVDLFVSNFCKKFILLLIGIFVILQNVYAEDLIEKHGVCKGVDGKLIELIYDYNLLDIARYGTRFFNNGNNYYEYEWKIYINPKLFFALPEQVRTFVYYNQCAHLSEIHLGTTVDNILEADFLAINFLVSNKYFNNNDVNIVYNWFIDPKNISLLPNLPGRERAEHLLGSLKNDTKHFETTIYKLPLLYGMSPRSILSKHCIVSHALNSNITSISS